MATANGKSSLPITWGDLEPHIKWADGVMSQARYRPQKRIIRSDAGLTIRSIPPNEQLDESVSFAKLAHEISGASNIWGAEVNKVALTVRNALCIGLYIADQYCKRSGLDINQQFNRAGALASAQQAEFTSKVTTGTAAAMFAAASYIVFELSAYEESKVTATKMEIGGVPELYYRSPQIGLMSMMYHFGSYCSQGCGLVNNGIDLVKCALLYFTAVLNEINDKKESFTFTQAFEDVQFKVDQSDFVVRGFEMAVHAAILSVDFRRVKFNEIVGNRRAKHQAKRTAMILCCYDLIQKMNPFLSILSFALTRMGYGVPGTGKSIQIAATATMIEELCDKLGLTFLFWPMPGSIVSTFQGGSGERMEQWMRRLDDADKIVYMPIDDAENNFVSRTRENVSSGVKEVIGEFLRRTEGASAIIRGNAVIELFTNLPEVIDAAVLSRVQQRFPIDGARTVHDFVDQDYLWWNRYNKIDEKFVSMSHASGYKWLEDQKDLVNLAELEAMTGNYKVRDPKIAEIIAQVEKKYPRNDHSFYGEVFHRVQQQYPLFSSRDVRNIQSAVDGRILDFDLPGEWFDDPKLFYQLPYEQKVELLREQVRISMKGFAFADIRFEETLRYLDTLAEIANIEFERDVNAVLKRIRINSEAEKRYHDPMKNLDE